MSMIADWCLIIKLKLEICDYEKTILFNDVGTPYDICGVR